MSKVLLQCASLTDSRYLKDLLEKSSIDYDVRVQATHSNTSSKSYLAYEPVNLFVYVTPDFSEKDFRFVSEVKNKYFDRGLLVLTEKLSFKEFHTHKNRKGIHMLEKPFSKDDLLGLAERLVKDPFSKQQKFRRYRTRQNSTVESLITGKSSESTMTNLSIGGAFFETDGVDYYNIDDLLRLRISLTDVSRQHNLIGKVVWRTIQHQKSGRAGIGIEFVKKGEFYNQLIRKIKSQNPAMAHIFD